MIFKKSKCFIFLCTVILVMSLTSCGRFQYDESLGSANTPEGTTLMVSIFTSDKNYSWNFDDEEDVKTRDNILSEMNIATKYLNGVTEKYGKESKFIYDFEENDDLYYEADFDVDTTEKDAYGAEESMNQFLDENVDSDALRQKYKADNIIYFMIVNTDETTQAVTCTRNHYEGMEHPYEIIFLYNVDSGLINCPAVYAHEMLHAYGAPDLYYEDEEYGFTKEFLTYVQENMPNDLMYTCSDLTTGDYIYDDITNEVSELDAYYAGLTDTCELVDQFHLNPSQHVKAKNEKENSAEEETSCIWKR